MNNELSTQIKIDPKLGESWGNVLFLTGGNIASLNIQPNDRRFLVLKPKKTANKKKKRRWRR